MPEPTSGSLRRQPQPTPKELLMHLILERGYRPGDPLPTEAELSAELNLGRSSVREGMRALESLGIVRARQGVGSTLEETSLDGFTDGILFWSRMRRRDGSGSLRAITEVREALETGLIRAAVAAATEESIATMRECVDRMRAAAAGGEYAPDADTAFHRALYAPLDNWILDSLIVAFWKVHALAADTEDGPLGTPAEIADIHVGIVEAIETQDVDAARAAMLRHFHLPVL